MQTYLVYGLTVQSELPLWGPVTSLAPPDVTIHYGSVPEAIAEPSPGAGADATAAQILTEKTGLARYLIQGGNRITIDAGPGADLGILQANVLGGGMAILLKQRGCLVLHASAIAMDQGAIAFTGGAGWGKSTLVAYCWYRRGYRIITDDILALTMAELRPTTRSSYPRLKLSSDIAQALELNLETLPYLHENSSKRLQSLEAGFHADPCPLQALVILKGGEALEIQVAKPHDAFQAVMAFSNTHPQSISPTQQVPQLQQCAKLIQTTPILVLKRPRWPPKVTRESLLALDETIQVILDFCQKEKRTLD
jgi:hypothetical protein